MTESLENLFCQQKRIKVYLGGNKRIRWDILLKINNRKLSSDKCVSIGGILFSFSHKRPVRLFGTLE